MRTLWCTGTLTLLAISAMPARSAGQAAQNPPLPFVQPQGPAAPPLVITLQNALERAKVASVELQLATVEAQLTAEDRIQAKAGRKPSLNHETAYTGTQGNGVLPSGRYVTSDGIHVYRSQAILHQEFSADMLMKTDLQRVQIAEALARARVEIARRGLGVAVTRAYYGLVVAQRKYATTEQGVTQSRRFLEITQQQENLGEVAHSDVVKAELQYQRQKQGYDEAAYGIESARLELAVLMFPTLNQNFTVVDDLESSPALASFAEVQTMAERENPEIRAANEAVQLAGLDIRSARNAFKPTLSFDAAYGIEANAFRLHSTVAADPQAGPLPNLGYFVAATLKVPIFDWGTRQSKVRQAETREKQAQLQVTQSQRQIAASLYAAYNEAVAAKNSIDAFRRTAELAAQSLDLTNLRYRAGESTAFEVVESQNLLVESRNAFADAQARYRAALATIQSMTGGF